MTAKCCCFLASCCEPYEVIFCSVIWLIPVVMCVNVIVYKLVSVSLSMSYLDLFKVVIVLTSELMLQVLILYLILSQN